MLKRRSIIGFALACVCTVFAVSPVFAKTALQVQTKAKTVAMDAANVTPEDAFKQLVEKELGSSSDEVVSVMGSYKLSDKLTGNDKKAYDIVAREVKRIAAGKRSSTTISFKLTDLGLQEEYTAEDLGVQAIIVENPSSGQYEFAQDALNHFEQTVRVDFTKVMDAILSDLPYEAYWIDKSIGFSYKSIPDYGTDFNSNYDYVMKLTEDYLISIYVSRDYSTSGTIQTYAIDTSKAAATKTAADNAAAIVETYVGRSDEDMIRAYANKICDLTDYNWDAFYNNPPYGDPWQMIYVFDGVSSTKVVCEGYSKAFQYLCDRSQFDDDRVYACCVTGTLEGGAHMWNIVHMDDNKNYLADITQMDEDRGYGILEGVTGDVASGYTHIGGTTTGVSYRLKYVYDSDTKKSFAPGDLTLSSASYQQHTHDYVNMNAGKAATCVDPGRNPDQKCTICDRVVLGTETSPTGIHDYVSDDNAVAATCKDGKESDQTCSMCGDVIIGKAIPGTGVHTYASIGGAIPATCKDGKEDDQQCSVCGDIKTGQTIPATGTHTYENIGGGKPATCKDGKEDDQKCSVCGDIKTGQTIPATGIHDYVSVGNGVAASCRDGKDSDQKCSVCDDIIYGQTIPANGKHDYVNVGNGIPANCKDGKASDQKCSICGDVIYGQAIPATGIHTYGAWRVINQPTVNATGLRQRTCTVCGGEPENQTIAKLPAPNPVMNAAGTLPLKLKKTAQLVVTGDQVVAWTSSNPKIVTVANGKIKGVKKGSAVVSARCASGKTLAVTVKVQKGDVHCKSFVLNTRSVTLMKGQKFALKVSDIKPITCTSKKLSFKSSKKKIATVSSKGVIQGKKAGKSTITVKVGKKSMKVSVVVR